MYKDGEVMDLPITPEMKEKLKFDKKRYLGLY